VEKNIYLNIEEKYKKYNNYKRQQLSKKQTVKAISRQHY